MGLMRHHAILVTAWDDEGAQELHAKAKEVFPSGSVSGLLTGEANGYSTFAIGPDGSKEGWETSNRGDERRNAFVKWLEAEHREGKCDWVEVVYGNETGSGSYITRPHCDD